MKLKECSKADLLWVIRRMCAIPNVKHELECALNALSYEKEKARLDEAERWGKIADEKRRAYIELLRPYEGMRWVDIPEDVLEQADRLIHEADAAEQKFMQGILIEPNGKQGVKD